MNSDLESSKYPVYTGVWTNWSRGRVLGATLTISRHDADLLIAFTAFFIAFVGTRVWRIICFVTHRNLSTPEEPKAIYHQQQVILRNASNPEDATQLFLKLFWANRRSDGRFRPLLMVMVAAFCIAAFTVAGGYSSQITTAVGDEVLIKSANCRALNPTLQNQSSNVRVNNPQYARWINSAANYAQQCYSADSAGLVDCRRFAIRQLTNNMDQKAICPFDEAMCRDSSSNIRIDSGFVDSHTHFGLNSPPHERIIWRNVLHCAPINTANFTSQKKTDLGLLTLYHYGNIYDYSVADAVYAAKSVESQYASDFSEDIQVSYSAFSIQTVANTVYDGKTQPMSVLFPISALDRGDAETYLIFLEGNGVMFLEPEGDEWYRIGEAPPINPFSNWTDAPSLYIPLEPASPLGCADQYQFCNPAYNGRRVCGPLASYTDAVLGSLHIFNLTREDRTNYQLHYGNIEISDTAARFLYFLDTFDAGLTIDAILSHMGPASLLSQEYLVNGVQSHLESNQWQLDVAHWWDIAMSGRQAAFLDAAYSSPDPSILASYVNFTSPAALKLCQNQKMRTTAYASFSLLGFTLTFVVGFLLATFSYIQEPLVTWSYKRKGRKPYQHLEWVSNATLQLHRLAHEEMGWGEWSNCTETIPTTKDNNVLGCLDIADPTHPRIKLSHERQCGPDGVQNPIKIENTSYSPGRIDDDSIPASASGDTLGSSTADDEHPDANVPPGQETEVLQAATVVEETYLLLGDAATSVGTSVDERGSANIPGGGLTNRT
ncbi:hypothetical protein F5B21DRAFT_529296 [Xylaria acuta]|nr:hypothetical protein F5B21DRAFT_529296 [Xylaria acuta]